MNEYSERTRWDDGPAIGSGFGRKPAHKFDPGPHGKRPVLGCMFDNIPHEKAKNPFKVRSNVHT